MLSAARPLGAGASKSMRQDLANDQMEASGMMARSAQRNGHEPTGFLCSSGNPAPAKAGKSPRRAKSWRFGDSTGDEIMAADGNRQIGATPARGNKAIDPKLARMRGFGTRSERFRIAAVDYRHGLFSSQS